MASCDLCCHDIVYDEENETMIKVCKVCIDKHLCGYCTLINSLIHRREECPYCKTPYTYDGSIDGLEQVRRNSVSMTKEQFAKAVICYWQNNTYSFQRFERIFGTYMDVCMKDCYKHWFIKFIKYGGSFIIDFKDKRYLLTSNQMLKESCRHMIAHLFEIFDIKGILVMSDMYSDPRTHLGFYHVSRDGDELHVYLDEEPEKKDRDYDLEYLAREVLHTYHRQVNNIHYWVLLRGLSFNLETINPEKDDNRTPFWNDTPRWYVDANKIHYVGSACEYDGILSDEEGKDDTEEPESHPTGHDLVDFMNSLSV